MKKLLSAAVAVLALAMAFVGCSHEPAGPAEYSYTVNDTVYPITLDLNGDNGNQGFTNAVIPANVKLMKDDTVNITIKTKANAALKNLKAVIIDNAQGTTITYDGSTVESYGWHPISDYVLITDEDEEVTAETVIEKTIKLTISDNQLGTGADAHKLVLMCDKADAAIKLYASDAVIQGAITVNPAASFDFESYYDGAEWLDSYIKGGKVTVAKIGETLALKQVCDNYCQTVWVPVDVKGKAKITGVSGKVNRLANSNMGWKTLTCYINETAEYTYGTLANSYEDGTTFQNASTNNWDNFSFETDVDVSGVDVILVGFTFNSGANTEYAFDDITITTTDIAE